MSQCYNLLNIGILQIHVLYNYMLLKLVHNKSIAMLSCYRILRTPLQRHLAIMISKGHAGQIFLTQNVCVCVCLSVSLRGWWREPGLCKQHYERHIMVEEGETAVEHRLKPQSISKTYPIWPLMTSVSPNALLQGRKIWKLNISETATWPSTLA